MSIDPSAYAFLKKYLLEGIGYDMGSGKEYLVEARLTTIAPIHGCSDASSLIRKLQLEPTASLKQAIIDSMVTNESLFFRDDVPFQYLRNEALPRLVRARAASRTLRIWSAACSTGQEPFSIAIILREEAARLGLNGWNIDLLASDISTNALSKAKAGIFSNFEIQRGLPEATRNSYSEQVQQGWRFRQEAVIPIRFIQHNLLDRPPAPGHFDLIFLRNVLIYFEPALKMQVLSRLSQSLAPDGCLFLGAAECILDPSSPISRIEGAGSSIYRKKENPHVAQLS